MAFLLCSPPGRGEDGDSPSNSITSSRICSGSWQPSVLLGAAEGDAKEIGLSVTSAFWGGILVPNAPAPAADEEDDDDELADALAALAGAALAPDPDDGDAAADDNDPVVAADVEDDELALAALTLTLPLALAV